MGVWKALVAPTLGGKQLWADVFARDGYCIQRNVFGDHHRLLGPGDGRLAWGSYDECRQAFQDTEREPWADGTHVVLLLHGYLRAKDAFKPMTAALDAGGYAPVPINYPSMWRGLDDHAAQLREVLNGLQGRFTVSLVGHSMGGLIARQVLAEGGSWTENLTVNRLVMLGVPNQGAELADRLSNWWWYRTLGGPASTELTTTRVPDLPAPTCAFGNVAGVRGNGSGWNPLIPGEDDGIVTYESTRIDGAEDTLTLPCIHALLMRHPRVIGATLSYLRTGRFEAQRASAEDAAALV
jgi:pimeloyl-ACP methyl ester carboxylesterase